MFASGASDGSNYFGLSAVVSDFEGIPFSDTTLTVQQAYSIDAKVDDGMPQSGRVMALYVGAVRHWAAGGANSVEGQMNSGAQDSAGGPVTAGDGVATAGTANTCYDNGNAPGMTEQYSMEINGGAGANCALSFRFQ